MRDLILFFRSAIAEYGKIKRCDTRRVKMTNPESVLLEKLRRLPPEQIEVVEQFIDELLVQKEERLLVLSAQSSIVGYLQSLKDRIETLLIENF